MTADRKLLEALHNALGEQLLARIQSGEATAADLNVARAWLKDNRIEALPTNDNPLGKIAEALPVFDDGVDETDLPILN